MSSDHYLKPFVTALEADAEHFARRARDTSIRMTERRVCKIWEARLRRAVNIMLLCGALEAAALRARNHRLGVRDRR